MCVQGAERPVVRLEPGLNLISIPGVSSEEGEPVDRVFGSDYPRVEAIWRLRDEGWEVHVGGRLDLSDFHSLHQGVGYFLYLSEGSPVDWEFDLPRQGLSVSIIEGSNLVGYGGASAQPIEEIFAQSPAEIKEFRTVIGGEWRVARRDGSATSLTAMEVGRGYVAESESAVSWFNRLVFSGGESSFATPTAAAVVETSDGLAFEAAENEILVSVGRQSTSEELGQFAAAIADAGMEIVGDGGTAGLIQVRFPAGISYAVAETLISDLPAVRSTTPNMVVVPDSMPVSNEEGRASFPHLVYDPASRVAPMSWAMEATAESSDYPWWVSTIKGDQAWGITEGSRSDRAIIGIVDRGFIPEVIESDRLTTVNFDGKALSDPGGTLSNPGHGTFVSLFAAGSGRVSEFDNPVGVARNNPVVYSDPDFSFTRGGEEVFFTDLQRAANATLNQGSRAVNVSWGAGLPDSVDHTEENLLSIRQRWREGWAPVLASANDRDALFVFSAGNDGGGNSRHKDFVPGTVTVHNDDQLYRTGSPADENVWLTNALIVAATKQDNNPTSFSRRGNVVNLAAPGAGVSPGGRFGNTQGTSFSAPMVTGAAGLVMSQAPGLRALEVRQVLLDTADRTVIPARDADNAVIKVGGGMLNVYEAVKTAADLAGLPEEVLSVTLPNLGEAPLTETVSVTLAESGVELLDVVFCVDVSGSYGAFINTFKSVASDIMNDIATAVPNSRFAMTSFSDFPIAPYGVASAGDKAFYLDQPLTADIELMQEAIDELRIYNGGDLPESQLEALYQILTGAGRTVDAHPQADLEPRSVGWRTGALRVIILATDINFHDSDTDPNYPGAGFSEVLDLLQSTGTVVIGLESPNLGATRGDMDRLVDATNGQIFGLDLAATGIGDIILEGLDLTLQQILVEPLILGDPYGYISSITPESYIAVPGETVEFTVEFPPQARLPQDFARKSSVIWFRGDRSAVLKRVPVDTLLPAN